MNDQNSKHSHHEHRHHHGETNHPHDHDTHAGETPSLSRRDKLIVRLEHTIRHNQDHAATYSGMAEEAQEIGAEQAARTLRLVAEQTARQIEDMGKALAALKSL